MKKKTLHQHNIYYCGMNLVEAISYPHLQLIHDLLGFVNRVQWRVCSTNAL